LTVLWGDTGKVAYGALKSFTITGATPRETLLGTPLVLPTTEPASGQITWTIQSSDLPTITPNAPMKFNASLVCGGKVGATAATISYRILLNGTSVVQSSGASATATQFWGHTHWRTSNVQVGDTIEIRYWSNQTDTNLDFYGLIVYPSQPSIIKLGTILSPLNISSVSNGANFVSAGLAINNTQAFVIYPYNSNQGVTYLVAINFNAIAPSLVTAVLYKLSSGSGENASAITQQFVNATQRQYQKQWFPTTISFREILR
jgi:hypothetical protein